MQRRIVRGDRVRFTAKGTPWEGEDPSMEGVWGTVTSGDDHPFGDARPRNVLIVRWDLPDFPGLVARELLQAESVIEESPA